MDFFFSPKGIAIIGATPNPLKGGYNILKNMLIGYKGGIYPVNPKYKEIEGLTCYDSVQNVPDPVDLAIVILKGGKSKKGARAAMSHTSSLAGDAAVISGALAQAHVTEANDFKQMLDLCRTRVMYAHIKNPGKGRTAVLTYSGGAGIVSADFIDQLGLDLADLSPQTFKKLAEVFPEWMPPSNPVDMWPAIEKNGPEKVYKTAFEAVFSDPNVDAVLFHIFIGGIFATLDILPLVDIARKHDKPLFVWLLGKREEAFKFQLHVQGLGVPVYRELQRAVECMSALFK